MIKNKPIQKNKKIKNKSKKKYKSKKTIYKTPKQRSETRHIKDVITQVKNYRDLFYGVGLEKRLKLEQAAMKLSVPK